MHDGKIKERGRTFHEKEREQIEDGSANKGPGEGEITEREVH